MKRFRLAIAMLIAAGAILVMAPTLWASAPRRAIAQCGLALKKLDLSSPPSYPSDYWGADGPANLIDDVEYVQNLMTTPEATGGWCDPIGDIQILAVTTMAYFDITRSPNPAQTEFLQDWYRIGRLAGCW